MSRKNVIIAPCGNQSFLFRQSWLNNEAQRNFDLCLLFYHDHIEQPGLYEGIDYFFHLKNFKYKMVYELLVNIRPDWLEIYDHFYFLDDDIEISTDDINKLFDLSYLFGSSICCASLSADSFCSWPIFKQNSNCYLRYVGQIEVMAPLFNKQALKLLLPTFIETRSSWGLDSIWSKLLGYPQDKLIIFDRVIMKHTLPVGGGELYQKIGVDPKEEWNDITRKYNAKLENYREYGRLAIFTESNLVFKFQNKIRYCISVLKRLYNDSGINERIWHSWPVKQLRRSRH